MKIFLLLLTFCFVAFSPAVLAEEKILCEALSHKEAYQKDKSFRQLIEGQDGWIFRTEADFRYRFQMKESVRHDFKAAIETFKQHGITVVVALLPTRGMMHHDLVDNSSYDVSADIQSYRKTAEDLRHMDVAVAEIDDFSSGQAFFYKRDHHWNAEGARKMAQLVAQKVRLLPPYAAIEKKKFITDKSAVVAHRDSFSRFIEKICHSKLFPEQTQTYKTYAEGSDNLFSEESPADIVLIATSNGVQSTSDANFDGFLKEYIGADVDNFSVSGGRVDTPMLDWLASPSFKKHKPKIIVWELAAYQNFKDSSLFRQVAPALAGDCSDNAVVQNTIAVSDGRFTVLDNIEAMKILADKSYLSFNFSDFSGLKFRATAHYVDGSQSSFKFDRPKVPQPDGRFFIDFPQDKGKEFSSVDLFMPDGMAGQVTARLCRYP